MILPVGMDVDGRFGESERTEKKRMGYVSKYPEGLQKYIASLVEQNGGHYNRVARKTGLDHKIVRKFVQNVKAAENSSEGTADGVDRRFKELRKHFGLTQTKFAEPLKCSQMDVSQIELGNFRRLAEIAPKVCDHYNVRQEWLMKGEGEIFKQKEEVSDQRSILFELKEIRILLRELIDLEEKHCLPIVSESKDVGKTKLEEGLFQDLLTMNSGNSK